MNKTGLLTSAAAIVPGLFSVRRRTWLVAGLSLLVLFALLIWAAVALVSGLWGQARNVADAAPDAVRGTTRAVIEQIEMIAPNAREKLGEFVPALKPGSAPQSMPQRDVSGDDLGPVTRYQGVRRTYWQQDGVKAVVAYEGKADYVQVLDHYAKGFAAQGFTQFVQSAAPRVEAIEYRRGGERFLVRIAHESNGLVSVRIETVGKRESVI